MKRDINEDVDFRNIYIGLKTESLNYMGCRIAGLKTYTIMEKVNYNIGEVGKEPYSIYKDLEEEEYSYVAPNGRIFVPYGKTSYKPSTSLYSLTKMKSLREIINKIIDMLDGDKNLSDETKKSLEYFKYLEAGMKKCDEKNGTGTTKLEGLQKNHVFYYNLYDLAFGNPFMEEDLSRAMTDEEIEEQDTIENNAKDARSNFKVIK